MSKIIQIIPGNGVGIILFALDEFGAIWIMEYTSEDNCFYWSPFNAKVR